MDDLLILDRLRSQTPNAGSALVDRYYDDLFRFLRHLTRDADESEDLVQQTLLRALKAIRSFDGRCSLRTWLHRIAYREFLNWRRGRRVLLSLSPTHWVRESNYDRVDDAEALLAALRKLTPATAAAFLLLEVQELTVAETAEVLGIPAGTVKSRAFDAREKLQRHLGDIPVEASYGQKTI